MSDELEARIRKTEDFQEITSPHISPSRSFFFVKFFVFVQFHCKTEALWR